MKSIIENNKFYFSLTLIGVLLSIGAIFQGCQKDSDLFIADDYISVNEKLQNDADLLYLIQIKEEITNRIINSETPLDEIKEAFLIGDEEFINKALSYSEMEMNEVRNSILKSGNNIINRYPLIETQVNKKLESDCVDCFDTKKIDFLFANLEKTTFTGEQIRLKNDGESSSVDWAGYTLCIAACSLTAPTVVGYIACCALCVYTFGPF